ncbi:hypothetical protein OUZ56_022803 [Daphnia magna]|uniref:Uncharacterized protein n=1 Tax=Daphnia magna TaxID=35525 RepID=A0ABR0AXJ3_9CRUS|nr:hypothetical protein OUZ56_022803 [Daphnia magna]
MEDKQSPMPQPEERAVLLWKSVDIFQIFNKRRKANMQLIRGGKTSLYRMQKEEKLYIIEIYLAVVLPPTSLHSGAAFENHSYTYLNITM